VGLYGINKINKIFYVMFSYTMGVVEISTPKVILFDCWNTLFTARPSEGTATRLSRNIFRRQLNYRFLKLVERDLMLGRHDDLSIPAKQILKDMRLPTASLLVRRVEGVILQSLQRQRPFVESMEVLGELKQDYRLGMISNTFHQSFQPLREKFELDSYFEYIIPSYEVGLIKPNPKIFMLALEKFEVRPDEAIMVGDNWNDDVLGARAVGMRGILIDRSNRWPKATNKITSLTQLKSLISISNSLEKTFDK
jgi:2-haloalkanoic acid dehalogenase type II